MAEYISDCPRCGASNTTFDVCGNNHRAVRGGWVRVVEAYCVCRGCKKAVLFVLSQAKIDDAALFGDGELARYEWNINTKVREEGFISIKNMVSGAVPEYLPPNIEAAFKEGLICLSVECFNAAGTMFRLCVDIASAALLPSVDSADSPAAKIRRDLGLRLPWLFEHQLLAQDLHDLSSCVKEDGNDGAHKGTLSKAEAEDLEDFTFALLERLYTEPARILAARERREKRRRTPD